MGNLHSYIESSSLSKLVSVFKILKPWNFGCLETFTVFKILWFALDTSLAGQGINSNQI